MLRRHRIVCTRQTRDGVEQYHHVVAALHHPLGFLQHEACDLHVLVGLLVESRGYHLGIDTAAHVGHLFRTLVDKQYHYICFGMILGYGVGDIFKKYCFTRSWEGPR